jgi:hypothetical protein
VSAIIISPRGPRISVGSLWRLREKVQREVGPSHQVGIHLRAEVAGADFDQPFVDIVIEQLVRGQTIGALVRALKAATERWRASEAAPTLLVARVRVWAYDSYGQLRLEWEEKTGNGA